MSRLIKFRLWDNNKNKMYYGGEFGGKDTRDGIFVGAAYDYDKEKLLSETCRCVGGDWQGSYWETGEVVEQYTCLKDKNGKEIYEGDLIRLSTTEAPAVKGRNLVVKFDEFDIGEYACQKMVGWMVETVDDGGRWASSLSDVVSFCEIVGNIHEPIDKFNRV